MTIPKILKFHLLSKSSMSTSDLNKKYTLRVELDDEYKHLVKISVFNSQNRIIPPLEKSSSKYVYTLTKGLYTIRLVMNGEIKDKIFTLNADKDFIVSSNIYNNQNINIIEPPRQYSSALLDGNYVKTYDSSHEYYTYPAIDTSQKDTFVYTDNANSSLFIFMRYPSYEKYMDLQSKRPTSFYQNFEIINEEGESIIHFESGMGIEINDNHGWVAFNAMLPNGIYYLLYHGNEPRQIPIYVFKNWHTQFFMTLGEKPLFGTIRIFITRVRIFNPKEPTHRYIDILLDKLQNKDYAVDRELIKIAAQGKYESPMLGLICSYLYCKTPNKQLIILLKILSKKIKNIILKDNEESADLRALEILADGHFEKKNFKKTPIKGTPMLRIGFEAIQNAAIEYKDLIEMNSVNDFISESLYYDSPFNTFKPICIYNKKNTLAQNEESIDNNSQISDSSTESFEQEDITKYATELFDLKNRNVMDYLKQDITNFQNIRDIKNEMEGNWVQNSITEILSKEENISIKDISVRLNLPENTINRILANWNNSENKGELL